MPLHTEPFTIGVEEEYQIIDPLTHELSQSPGADSSYSHKNIG